MARTRILIVDDEVSIAQYLSKNLSLLAPEYEVETARTAREALAMMGRHPVELMVTDLRLPGIDGLELMRQVRERHPHTRLILITGYGDARSEAQALQIGAARYLNKPFLAEDLLDAIRQALAPAVAYTRGGRVPPDTRLDVVSQRLSDLLSELGAQCVLLADISGRVVAQVGDAGELDPATLGSLIGSSFTTSFELARYLQESEAVTLNYHEGARHDIYACNINAGFFVVILFDKRSQGSRLGMVWLYLRRALTELDKLLSAAAPGRGGPRPGAGPDPRIDEGGPHVGPRQVKPRSPQPQRPAAPSRAPGSEMPGRGPAPATPPPMPPVSLPQVPQRVAPPRPGAPEDVSEKQEPPPPVGGAPTEAPRPETETFDLAQAIAMGLLDASWGQEPGNDEGAGGS